MRSFNTYLSRLGIAVIVILLCCTFARAVDGKRTMSQYLRQRWEAPQGLPGMVNALAQTPDGYLWIGTDSGLYRFDGRGFRQMRPAAADIGMIDHVRALAADSDGALWIWMQSTSLLRYDHGKFEQAGGAAWDRMRITAMSRANGEGILLSTLSRGNVHLTRDRLAQLGQFRGTLSISVAQTTDGRVWLGSRERGLMALRNGKFQPVEGKLPDQKMNCLLPGPNGQLWIGTDSGLAFWDGKGFAAKSFPAPLDHAQILSLVLDRDGNLWAGTSQGLVRYSAGTVALLPTLSGESQSPVTTVIEDREGNLWFGGPRGIERLRDSTFASYSGQTGLPPTAPGAVYVDAARRVWFAPRTGGISWFRGGVEHPVTANRLADDVVYSITGNGNNIWLGQQSGGVTHLVMSGDNARADTTQLRGARYSYVVYAAHASRDGSVWLGTLTGGAFHLADGKLTQFTERDGLLAGSVYALEEDRDGTVYVGTSSGLSVLDHGRWHSYQQMAGLPMGEVTTLLEDSQGVLWVGTSIGLGYLTDQGIAPAGRDRALFHERILGIAEDDLGWLWMSSPSHVFRVRRSSLLSGTLADGDVRIFDEADGLRGMAGVRRSRSVVSDPDGLIWIVTTGGLAVANPGSERRSSLAAIPHVEQVLVDGVPPTGNDGTVGASAQKRIAFNFTGLSFRAPERVRYRYRLDGFDRGWSEPTAETQAIYTNLSPGEYEFRVMASDSDGQWSPLEASEAVRILPRFWQTWWFRAALLLLALLAGVLLYQLRMRALVRSSNRMLEERLTERTRIAQELHDTLLQGFFSASMQLHVIADQVEPASATRTQLDRILVLMGKVLDQGRDAVKGLRSSAEDSVWLEDACEGLASELAVEGGVRYKVNVEGNARELRHGVQAELCRIVQESLANATRHAQATAIDVMIRYQPQALRVAVRDNGVGLAPEVIAHGRDGHWGLPGMRERAESIGGTLEITSVLDSGTAVELAVPANAAYRRYMKNGVLNWLVEVYRARSMASHAPPEPRTND